MLKRYRSGDANPQHCLMVKNDFELACESYFFLSLTASPFSLKTRGETEFLLKINCREVDYLGTFQENLNFRYGFPMSCDRLSPPMPSRTRGSDFTVVRLGFHCRAARLSLSDSTVVRLGFHHRAHPRIPPSCGSAPSDSTGVARLSPKCGSASPSCGSAFTVIHHRAPAFIVVRLGFHRRAARLSPS